MDAKTVFESPLQSYLNELYSLLQEDSAGALADYIPELAKADPSWFGIALVTVDGQIYQVGDSQHKFTIQSISKPFTYGMAMDIHGSEKVKHKVGVEPSGEAFNEISLEEDSGRPFNPMINAGAIATTGLIQGDEINERFKKITKYYSDFAAYNLGFDDAVYKSESATGNRNRAIAYLLRNSDILENDTEETLDVYFRQCSILVNCRDLAVMGATLANNGINPITGVVSLKSANVEKVLSIMSSCGMYDYAGGWIYDVGMPAKSGVAGGIMAVLPGQFGIGVFSPLLDKHGNSDKGIKVCNKISIDFGLHMFDSSKASNSVIRASYDTTTITSKRTRSKNETKCLKEFGGEIKIYELTGDLIFSSTDFVLETVLKALTDTTYVVFDFKRVTSAKRSACYLLANLVNLINKHEKHVYFTNTAYQFTKNLKYFLDKVLYSETLRFSDNDDAIEYCENKLIAYHLEVKSLSDKIPLKEQILLNNFNEDEVDYIKGIMEKQTYDTKTSIIKEEDISNSIYLITVGEVSINLRSEKNSQQKRITTLSAGMSFGEMSFFSDMDRSATVIAESDVEAYVLKPENFENIPPQFAHIKEKLLRNMTVDMANKLRKVNQEIRAYQ